MSHIVVEFDDAEATQLIRQSTARGYASVPDYLRALIHADIILGELQSDFEGADETSHTLTEDFREAWHDAMTNRIHPVESLWEQADDGEESRRLHEQYGVGYTENQNTS